MARKRKKGTRDTVTVTIDATGHVKSNQTDAKVADYVVFQNLGTDDRVVLYVVDDPEFASMYHPFGVVVPGMLSGSVLALDSHNMKDKNTVYYRIGTKDKNGKVTVISERDDPYQVIVGSSRRKKRK